MIILPTSSCSSPTGPASVRTFEEDRAWDLAAGLASALRWTIKPWAEFGEGACKLMSAHIACLLAEQGIESFAVRGDYLLMGDEADGTYYRPGAALAHWWLEVPAAHLLVDATREQFCDITPQTDYITDLRARDAHYVTLSRFASQWTREQAYGETLLATGCEDTAREISAALFEDGDELCSFAAPLKIAA